MLDIGAVSPINRLRYREKSECGFHVIPVPLVNPSLPSYPIPELESYLKRVNLKKFTDRTLSTARTLREELAKIRESGYAVDLAEGLENLCIRSDS